MQASAFKARCLAVLDDVARTRTEVVVTKHGKPVARLVPVDEPAAADAVRIPSAAAADPAQPGQLLGGRDVDRQGSRSARPARPSLGGGRAGRRGVEHTASTAVAAAELLGFHGDPADRFVVATAEAMGVPLVTKARLIHAFATDRAEGGSGGCGEVEVPGRFEQVECSEQGLLAGGGRGALSDSA